MTADGQAAGRWDACAQAEAPAMLTVTLQHIRAEARLHDEE